MSFQRSEKKKTEEKILQMKWKDNKENEKQRIIKKMKNNL